MLPILTELELLGRSLPVQTYGVTMFLALLVGLGVSHRNARRLGLDPDHLFLGLVLLLPPILVGAKLLPLVMRGELYTALRAITAAVGSNERPVMAAMAWAVYFLMPGGSTIGAALGGGVGLLAYTRYFRLPLGDVLDTVAPALALGLPVMRLGCLAAGCCFGTSTSLPWAVVYTDARAELAAGVPLGVHLHPAPLYEAIAALVLGAFLLGRLDRRAAAGEVFTLFVVGYGMIRLSLAPLRGDAPFLPGALLWLAVLAAGTAAWVWIRREQHP